MIWHSSKIEDVVEKLDSDIENGISIRAINEKYRKYGKNTVYSTDNKTFKTSLLDQLKSNTFIFSVIASLLYLIYDRIFKNGEIQIPVIVISLTLIYIFVAALLEARVQKSILSKSQESETIIRVLRNGVKTKLVSTDLVPGDILLLKEGDYIPADARLIESENLRCDESLLTGNVATVEKTHDHICSDIDEIENRSNMIYAGCYVAFGSCKAIVTDTGSYTERGKRISALLREQDVIIPIELKVKKTLSIITSVLAVLSIIFFVIGLFIAKESYDWKEFLLAAAVLFSSIAPGSYSLLITFNLVLGMRRARQNSCIVKKFDDIETICATNLIICDKTGTLTQSKMKTSKVYLNGEICDVDNFASESVQAFLKMAALSCDGDVKIDDFGRETHDGDIVETAILASTFRILKTDKLTLENEYPKMSEIPFDSDRKLKTVIRLIDGKTFAIVKGSALAISNICKDVDVEELEKISKSLSSEGYRVIGIAYKPLESDESLPVASEIETSLTFAGFIAVSNLPRFEAKIELEDAKKTGIKTIMLTKDVIETAQACAKNLGLLEQDSICITGEQLEALSDEEFDEQFERIVVYSDITSEQRLKIVHKWQEKGKIVALTGDSVSDVLSMHEAQVGCAMGLTGTEFAKAGAPLEIADDSYTAIVKGIKQVKSIYLNIRNSLKQAFTVNFALAIAMILGLVVFGEPMLPPMLVLLAGLFFNTVSIFCIAFEPPHKNILGRPIHKNDDILGKALTLDAIVGIVLVTVVSLIAYYFGHRSVIADFGKEYFFMVYSFSVLFLSLSNRTEESILSIDPFKNTFMSFSIVLSILALVVFTMVPIVSDWLLEIENIKIDQIVKCALLSAIVPVINEFYKIGKRKFIK